MRKHQILSKPAHPLVFDGRKNVAALLEKLQGISFQGRPPAIAYQIWKKMLGDRVVIMMGMSGAMVPAGLPRPAHSIGSRPSSPPRKRGSSSVDSRSRGNDMIFDGQSKIPLPRLRDRRDDESLGCSSLLDFSGGESPCA